MISKSVSKRIILFVFLLSALAFNCGTSETTRKSTEILEPVLFDSIKVVNDIKKYRENMEEESIRYNKIRRKVEADSKTTALTALFNDAEEMKKMSINYLAESTNKYREYFFRTNDYLLYVEEYEFFYSGTFNTPDVKLLKKVLNEYYFIDNILFYWTKDKSKISAEFYPERSKEIFADLKIILDQLSSE